ncbi:MAG: hypothetical protein GY795_32600 [Desulfobacterales bacterium]|nr:hypothetical protein [Desulfobacterales bacterium]
MPKRELYLFEIDDVFQNQVILPYKTGLLWAKAKRNRKIYDNYKLTRWFYYRENIQKIIKKIEYPDVIGFSCYIWNWEFTKKVASIIKKKWPNVLIIIGGQQPPTPERCHSFFKNNPFFDIIVHYEGENAFEEILIERLNITPNYNKILGCTIKKDGFHSFYTGFRKRINNIDTLPSPYLDGVYDELITKNNNKMNFKFAAVIETSRGCPFSCTYCELGNEYSNKVIRPSIEKIYSEIEWIASNRCIYLDNSDSNFGLYYNFHKKIAKFIVSMKDKYGCPDKFRSDWAKDYTSKIFPIAKILHNADILKGVTVGIQSLNPSTLSSIKRTEIDKNILNKFISLYKKNNIPIFLEFILGLPNESFDSFFSNIFEVMEYEFHNQIFMYPLRVFPNTLFNNEKYRNIHGLHSKTYQMIFHMPPKPSGIPAEKMDIVTGTNTMPYEDMLKARLLSWCIGFGHYLGTTQFIARFMKYQYSVPYKEFYFNFFSMILESKNTFLHEEYTETLKQLTEKCEGKFYWGRILPKIASFSWDYDEATAININYGRRELFYSEIRHNFFNRFNFDIDKRVIDDLIKYQLYGISHFDTTYPIEIEFDYNIHEVITQNASIQTKPNKLLFDSKAFNGQLFDWARDTLWWGRKMGKYKTTICLNSNELNL